MSEQKPFSYVIASLSGLKEGSINCEDTQTTFIPWCIFEENAAPALFSVLSRVLLARLSLQVCGGALPYEDTHALHPAVEIGVNVGRLKT